MAKRRARPHQDGVASGLALATASAPSTVPAPGRFSTTNALPRRSPSRVAQDARQEVSGSAGSGRDDEADIARRIVLRQRRLHHGADNPATPKPTSCGSPLDLARPYLIFRGPMNSRLCLPRAAKL